MDTGVCGEDLKSLLLHHLPSLAWWGLGTAIVVSVIYFVIAVWFVFTHIDQPSGSRAIEANNRIWTIGALPMAVVALVIFLYDAKAMEYFYDQVNNLTHMYNVICVYPLMEEAIPKHVH